MKKMINFIGFFSKSSLLILMTLLVFSQLNAEKYAGEIFKMGASVRNMALGRTGLTDIETTSKAYWNASLLAIQDNHQFEIMHAEEYNGNLQYDIFSGNIGNKNNIGFMITRIGIDDIHLTKVNNPDSIPSNDNRPFSYKTINNADYIAYFGLGRAINENLLVGISPKFVFRNIAEESAYGFGADLSATFLFNEDFRIAGRLRDFFSTQLFYKNGSHQSVNPGLDIESYYSMNIPKIDKKINIFINTEINSESMKESATTSLGLLSFDWHVGAEIEAFKNISLYTGYDIDKLNAGLSVNIKKFVLNYAFEKNTDLDNSHRISVGLNL